MPLVFSKRLLSPEDALLSLWAFLAFCAAASSVYLLNDILDLSRDKAHPLKKIRPIASGKISPALALAAALCLTVIAFLITYYALNPLFALVLGVYYLLGILYTLKLKHLVILDIFTLSLFYVLRILGGLAAIHASMSHWMIICVALLAMFIGFNKRRHEIKILGKSNAAAHREVLSLYGKYFIDQMTSVVTAATAVCYTLYTVDPETVARFGTHGLVLTVPFVYYGIFRYIYVIHRKGKGGDPVRIFLTDAPMILNACIWILTCAAIIYLTGRGGTP